MNNRQIKKIIKKYGYWTTDYGIKRKIGKDWDWTVAELSHVFEPSYVAISWFVFGKFKIPMRKQKKFHKFISELDGGEYTAITKQYGASENYGK